jgi:hypothetical protein
MQTRSFRRVISPALAAIVALTVWATVPTPTWACSCMAFEDPVLELSSDPATAIFTGVPQGRGPDGVPVSVTRWFTGPEPAGVVMLAPEPFDDPNGASCGRAAPPAGQEWIFAAPRDDTGRFQVHLCTPAGPVADASGQAMVARAQELFGPGSAPEVPAEEGGGDGGSLILFGAVTLAILGVLAGAVLVIRSSRDGRPT